MKKFSILLAFVAFAAGSMLAVVNPADVVGRWKSNPVTQESTPEMPMTAELVVDITMNADMTASITNDMSYTMELDKNIYADIFLNASASGTYKVEGDSITFTPRIETINLKFTEDDVRIRGIEDVATANSVQQQLFSMMSQGLEEMKQSMGEPQVLNDVVIYDKGKKMSVTDDDTKLEFKRKR